MKKLMFILFISLLTFVNVNAQTSTTTLINNNLDELFINKDNPYGPIPVKTVETYFTTVSKIYFFEIIYNGKMIFREAIKKSIPQDRDSELMNNNFRFKYDKIYINALEISDADKLKLLESYKNKIIDIAGKKIISLSDYQIVKKDYTKNKYIIIDPLENMKINIYRMELK